MRYIRGNVANVQAFATIQAENAKQADADEGSTPACCQLKELKTLSFPHAISIFHSRKNESCYCSFNERFWSGCQIW